MDGRLPGLLGLELIAIEHGSATVRMEIRRDLLAPNDFLHAGAVVTLADSACGMGCLASLPVGVAGFTTVELKSNFLRSARFGDALRCDARLAHGGRTTGLGRPRHARVGRQRPGAVPLHPVPAAGRRRAHPAAGRDARLDTAP
jgi:uncharacterized protein (TIGR00369 family)